MCGVYPPIVRSGPEPSPVRLGRSTGRRDRDEHACDRRHVTSYGTACVHNSTRIKHKTRFRVEPVLCRWRIPIYPGSVAVWFRFRFHEFRRHDFSPQHDETTRGIPLHVTVRRSGGDDTSPSRSSGAICVEAIFQKRDVFENFSRLFFQWRTTQLSSKKKKKRALLRLNYSRA